MQPNQPPQTPLVDNPPGRNGALPDDTGLRPADLTAADDRPGPDRIEDVPVRAADDDAAPGHLFHLGAAERFRVEWQQIQTSFVDDPTDAVQGADRLVAELLESLTDTVTQRKHELETLWHGESETATEDLRLVLRRYRALVNQLLDA